MNLLALGGALITASASVTTGSLKMENVKKVNNYPTNQVETIDDLVSGNYYHFQLDILYNDLSFEIDCTEIKNKIINVIGNDTTYSISGNHTKIEYLNESHRVNLVFSDLYDDTGEIIKYVGFQWRNLESFSISFDAKFFNWVGDISQFGKRYKVSAYSHNTKFSIYNTIYEFFYDLFDNEKTSSYCLNIMGVTTNLGSWLAHTVTIVLLLLGVLWLILVIRWIFRVFSGLVKI